VNVGGSQARLNRLLTTLDTKVAELSKNLSSLSTNRVDIGL
jgi:cell division protein ZapA (FtsZ GTPase activity inhibitor)